METCLEAFREMWIRPYGAPLKILLDQDGCFQGEMWEYLVRAGIEVEYVPAEAHYKLGKAERNNAIFREVLNRTADATGASNAEEMREAVDSCIHAVNSTPRTRGMSPYACVFGQIPRVPGELLADEHGLAVDVDDNQHRLRSLVFRAEAQKAVADVNVDSHVRRALLRKTAHTRVDDLPIGSKVAVCRSQLRGRSTKKKGGYVLGRLVAWDGSCGWIQMGWQTAKVDRAQLRPAVGLKTGRQIHPTSGRFVEQSGILSTTMSRTFETRRLLTMNPSFPKSPTSKTISGSRRLRSNLRRICFYCPKLSPATRGLNLRAYLPLEGSVS